MWNGPRCLSELVRSSVPRDSREGRSPYLPECLLLPLPLPHSGCAGRDRPHLPSSPLPLPPTCFVPTTVTVTMTDFLSVLTQTRQQNWSCLEPAEVRRLLTPPPSLPLPSICSGSRVCQAQESNASVSCMSIYRVSTLCQPLSPRSSSFYLLGPPHSSSLPRLEASEGKGHIPCSSPSLLQISGTRADWTAGAGHKLSSL